jgi:HEAT repeat protein
MARARFRELLKWWPVALACAIGVLAAGLAFIGWSIRAGVAENAALAQHEFPGDRVEALIAYVDSDRHLFRERNHAVWALGQIGDSRALPVLLKHYTGAECQHDRFLCQRELKKAIEGCASPNPNWLTRVVRRWRRGPD